MTHEGFSPEMPPQVQRLLDTNISRLNVADLHRLEQQITAAFDDISEQYELYEPLSRKIIEIQAAIQTLYESEEKKILNDQPPTPEDWNAALQESNFKFWQRTLRDDLSTFSVGELSDYVSWLRTTIEQESERGDNEYTRRYVETATAELERVREWRKEHEGSKAAEQLDEGLQPEEQKTEEKLDELHYIPGEGPVSRPEETLVGEMGGTPQTPDDAKAVHAFFDIDKGREGTVVAPPSPNELLYKELGGMSESELIDLALALEAEKKVPGRTSSQQFYIQDKIFDVEVALRAFRHPEEPERRNELADQEAEAQEAMADALMPEDAAPEDRALVEAVIEEKWSFLKKKRIMGQSINDIALSMGTGAALGFATRNALRAAFGIQGVVLGGLVGATSAVGKKVIAESQNNFRYNKARKTIEGRRKGVAPAEILNMISKGKLQRVDAVKLLDDEIADLRNADAVGEEQERELERKEEVLVNLKAHIIGEEEEFRKLKGADRLYKYLELAEKFDQTDKKDKKREKELDKLSSQLAIETGRQFSLKQYAKAAMIGAVSGAVGYTIGHLVGQYISTHFGAEAPSHAGSGRTAGAPQTGTTPGSGRPSAGPQPSRIRPDTLGTRSSADTSPAVDTTASAETPDAPVPEAPSAAPEPAVPPEPATLSSVPDVEIPEVPHLPPTVDVEVSAPVYSGHLPSVESVIAFKPTIPTGGLYEHLNGPLSTIDAEHVKVGDVLQSMADANVTEGPDLDAALALHTMHPAPGEMNMTVEEFLRHRVSASAELPHASVTATAPNMTVHVTPASSEVAPTEVPVHHEAPSHHAASSRTSVKPLASTEVPPEPSASPAPQVEDQPLAPSVEDSSSAPLPETTSSSPVEGLVSRPPVEVAGSKDEESFMHWLFQTERGRSRLLVTSATVGAVGASVGLGVGASNLLDSRIRRKVESINDIEGLKKLSDSERYVKLFDVLNPGRKKPPVLNKKELAKFKKAFKDEGNGAIFDNLLTFMKTKTESQRQEIIKAATVISAYNDATASWLPGFLEDVQHLPPASPEAEAANKPEAKRDRRVIDAANTFDELDKLTEEQKREKILRLLPQKGGFWIFGGDESIKSVEANLDTRRPQRLFDALYRVAETHPNKIEEVRKAGLVASMLYPGALEFYKRLEASLDAYSAQIKEDIGKK
jgi:hypothetical protein